MTEKKLYNKKLPSVKDLKNQAKRRIPSFAYEYVDGGIDDERGKNRNREAFHDIELTPRYLTDVENINTYIELFNHKYSLPIGVSPIGLGNMMWPDAELILARAAQKSNIPFILSTYSTTLLENIAEEAPDVCWYQLYLPKNQGILKEMIQRVKIAGFKVLVITIDIPASAKRNRELKSNIQLPFRLSPEAIFESFMHPRWSLEMFLKGTPDLVNVLPYKTDRNMPLNEFISDFMVNGVTKEHIIQVRKLWDGPLVLKGIQYSENAIEALNLGIDGIITSNHGGRQLDAAPSSLNSLQKIPDVVREKITIMMDSGVRTGLDVVRAKALGAEMIFSGRSFYWGVGAMGKQGGNQVIEIFRDEIIRTLKQLGCSDISNMDKTWVSE